MTATNHALTGAIIGLTVHNPSLAIPAAFLSHFICDIIPHYGGGEERVGSKGFVRYLIVDALLCILLVALLFAGQTTGWLQAAACAFVATSPDLLWIRKFLVIRSHKEFRPTWIEKFLVDIQWFQRPIGAGVEVIWFIGAIFILAKIV